MADNLDPRIAVSLAEKSALASGEIASIQLKASQFDIDTSLGEVDKTILESLKTVLDTNLIVLEEAYGCEISVSSISCPEPEGAKDIKNFQLSLRNTKHAITSLLEEGSSLSEEEKSNLNGQLQSVQEMMSLFEN